MRSIYAVSARSEADGHSCRATRCDFPARLFFRTSLLRHETKLEPKLNQVYSPPLRTAANPADALSSDVLTMKIPEEMPPLPTYRPAPP